MQEAYHPSRSKYSLWWGYLSWLGVPPIGWKVGTPCWLEGRHLPHHLEGKYPPSRNVNRQTPVKTVPSPFLRNAGGNYRHSSTKSKRQYLTDSFDKNPSTDSHDIIQNRSTPQGTGGTLTFILNSAPSILTGWMCHDLLITDQL